MRSRLLLTLALFGTWILSSTFGYAQNGQGFFSNNINWSQTPDLYYQVVAGPPLTCGALVTTRNSITSTTSNWLCTDNQGKATKGPWTYFGTPSDQFDIHTYILWPDGTKTTESWHVWDKTCPTISGTQISKYTLGFSGTAVDGSNGAGFSSSWSAVKIQFFEQDTRTYWDPATGTYHLATPPSIPATVTGLGSLPNSPSYSITWAANGVPPRSAHTDGYTYTWIADMIDGDSRCPAQPGSAFNRTFVYSEPTI